MAGYHGGRGVGGIFVEKIVPLWSIGYELGKGLNKLGFEYMNV